MPNSHNHKPKRNIGEELKKRRESLNISVEDVSLKLKIKAKDIVLLEQNSIHLLTKHLYLAGFIRSYCRLLKIRNEVTEEYLQNITKICNTKNKNHQLINLDSDEAKSPKKEYLFKAGVIFIVLYLILMAVGQFSYYNSSVTDLIVEQFENIE